MLTTYDIKERENSHEDVVDGRFESAPIVDMLQLVMTKIFPGIK